MGGTSLFRVGDAVELWRVLLHLSVLVACLLLFERVLHQLERRAAVSAKYQQLLSKAYRELMILGLIGLGLKLFKEAPGVDGSSAAMTAFQVADLTIFILALALILQAVCIFLMVRRHNVRADRAELLATEDLAGAVATPAHHQLSTRDLQELVHLRLLRHLFLTRFRLPQLFPFAKYLRQAQNNQITHMTDVGAPMWALLLAVAWLLEGITTALHQGEPAITKRRGLVFVLVGYAWALLLLHLAVHVYFRSCVQQLLNAAGLSSDRSIMECHLRLIACEEARAWSEGDAGKALISMQKVQEHYEKIRLKSVQLHESEHPLQSSTMATIGICWYSRNAWHFTVMMLLMLNGFYLALMVQCIAYQVGIVYADIGLVEVLAIPLPLFLNTLFLQPRLFRNFVLVSSVFCVDDATLSEVVNHFREIVELRSEFSALLWTGMQSKKLSVSDLHAELEARDPRRSGIIDIEKMRLVLRVFGLPLSSFRFNSVARLLFELKDMNIEYSQLLRLVVLAQSESLDSIMACNHPLLLQSALGEEGEALRIAQKCLYSPPRPLLGSTGVSIGVTTSLSSYADADVKTKGSHEPLRSQLKFSDNKYQGMSSRTLSGLFHIESALDQGLPKPVPDTNFAHV